MTATIEQTRSAGDETLQQDRTTTTDHGNRLRHETAAVRLRTSQPGTRKTLDKDQTRAAAGTFDAQSGTVSASKKLFDTSHPAFRSATNVRSRAIEYWKRMTLPYIDPGVRLLRRESIEDFESYMTGLQVELSEAADTFRRHQDELIDQARDRLGNLFDASDYRSDLSEAFGIDWDYPSCDPPAYLMRIAPQLYEAESRRARDRFDEAVRLAESAFAEELSGLVEHLAERLGSDTGGGRRVFRDTAVTNLQEFFDRFARLNIHSDEQLDGLIERARQITAGIEPQQLRTDTDLRGRVRRELTRVESSLDGYLVDRPRRTIIRKAR